MNYCPALAELTNGQIRGGLKKDGETGQCRVSEEACAACGQWKGLLDGFGSQRLGLFVAVLAMGYDEGLVARQPLRLPPRLRKGAGLPGM